MYDYSRLCLALMAAVKWKGKIAICPFGERGLLAKQILNLRYGIQEDYIIDNGLSDINPNILSVHDLKNIDTENLLVLLTTPNKEISSYFRKQLNEINSSIKIQMFNQMAVISSPEKTVFFKKLKAELQVKQVVGSNYRLVRLGKENDGGYVVLDDLQNQMVLYSFGIGTDVSYELDMANKGIISYLYDHTITDLPINHERFRFQRIGISAVDELENNKLSFPTLLKENKHEQNNNLLLKMDVEGAEWDFLDTISSDVLKQFRQLTFEFHGLTDIANENKYLGVLRKLNQSHQLVWIHANNCSYVERGDDNIEMPALLETTFVNRSLYNFQEFSYEFPLKIDMPNDPKVEEYKLGKWG